MNRRQKIIGMLPITAGTIGVVLMLLDATVWMGVALLSAAIAASISQWLRGPR